MEAIFSTSDDEIAAMGERGRELVKLNHSAHIEAGKLAAHFRDSISSR
jgi:hypothetical protein